MTRQMRASTAFGVLVFVCQALTSAPYQHNVIVSAVQTDPLRSETPDNEEFDPGSGRTLAACLMHASRTHIPSGV